MSYALHDGAEPSDQNLFVQRSFVLSTARVGPQLARYWPEGLSKDFLPKVSIHLLRGASQQQAAYLSVTLRLGTAQTLATISSQQTLWSLPNDGIMFPSTPNLSLGLEFEPIEKGAFERQVALEEKQERIADVLAGQQTWQHLVLLQRALNQALADAFTSGSPDQQATITTLLNNVAAMKTAVAVYRHTRNKQGNHLVASATAFSSTLQKLAQSTKLPLQVHNSVRRVLTWLAEKVPELAVTPKISTRRLALAPHANISTMVSQTSSENVVRQEGPGLRPTPSLQSAESLSKPSRQHPSKNNSRPTGAYLVLKVDNTSMPQNREVARGIAEPSPQITLPLAVRRIVSVQIQKAARSIAKVSEFLPQKSGYQFLQKAVVAPKAISPLLSN